VLQIVRRTLMPALCAERRAPPTAISRQPGRMRESTTCHSTAMTAVTRKLNGTPNTVPLPT
jgi:hypothetical protein